MLDSASIKCNNCGKDNPSDSLYCQYCGAELSVISSDEKLANELEIIELISKYGELFKSGIITEEEFTHKKAQLLKGIRVVDTQITKEASKIDIKPEKLSLKSKTCPNCGELNDSHKQFCAYCGVYMP